MVNYFKLNYIFNLITVKYQASYIFYVFFEIELWAIIMNKNAYK